ncbi:MAG: eukaryotic-like serine/threonine-protein kinase [Thermoleophilaceae bacterium]|nr:eukaryotic-like serine/threonine-protein kinase [Thermoleophilaceae bacterium]
MGVVWLAEEQDGLKRRAALKVLPTDLAHNEEIRERFLRESKYAERVKHPNIAEVYGAGEENGNLWLAMRYLEGTDLSSIIRRGGPLQPRQALSITGQAAAALDEAHESGLLHRDIKPANVMIASDDGTERAYVIDFGLGKAPATDEGGLTKPGQFVGTIDYTAPEQITQQQALDGKVDQYSLGCLLYEMLTGEVPFPKKRDVEVIMAHVGEPPPKASEKREGLPVEIDGVIAKAMAKDPVDRYPSCTAFFEAASQALAAVAEKDLDSDGSTPAGHDTVYLMFESGDEKGRVIQVTGDEFVIGRDDTADLQILDTRASRRHASLKVLPGGNAELRDMDSSNGTLLNGAPVKSAVLSGNERIRIGDTELSFFPVDPVRAKTTVGLTDKPRLSAVIAKRGQSAIQRLRIEKKLRNLTILAGSAVVAIFAVVILLLTGVLGGGGGANVAAVVSADGPATVFVKANSGDTGSGWVLDAGQGLIVTNGHVVNGGQSFQVGVGGQLRQATVVGDAPCDDLAVLKVTPANGLKTMPLGSQSNVHEGDDVVALGYPQSASADAKLTATSGVVSVARTKYQEATPDVPLYPNVIQVDAAINPGNSGGPLIRSSDKNLIGVNSAVRTVNQQGRTIQGQNYAIGIDRVKEVVNYLRTGKSVGWVGFNLAYPAPEDLGALPPGVKTSAGVAGTPAASVANGKTLLIVGVNGKRVTNSLASYCAAAGTLQSGQDANITVMDVTDQTHPGKPHVVKLRVP